MLNEFDTAREFVEAVSSSVSDVQHQAAKDCLRNFIERVERLEEEKQALMSDLREVFAEMKAAGYDTRVVKRLIRERRRDQHERLEEESVYATYAKAIGHPLAALD